MSSKWIEITKIAKIVVLVALISGSIGLVEKKYDERVCSSINVDIDNQFENYFINEGDVVDLVTKGGNRRIVGTYISELSLKEIEGDLQQTEFIRDAEVYKDLEGNLMVSINQSRPLARLMSSKMNDRYISTAGKVLPMSRRYTARVLLIDGPFADNAKLDDLTTSAYGTKLMGLLLTIENDDFWKAQIAQMNIDKRGNIKMFTQVSKQVVEFGMPEDIHNKFRKLKIFYKEILPSNGWNSYSTVSVKFKDQIVCE